MSDCKIHITNKISTIFGKFADKKFSPFFQKLINLAYVKILGLDMREFDRPSSYKTLNKLFTRELKKPREFDKAKSSFISPCDSKITAVGKLEKNTALQIKGMSYLIDGLLSKIDSNNIASLYDGNYINFYLSPRDYHRYHSPMDMRVQKVVHIPAKLYPVNEKYLKKQSNLFIENERVVLECQDSKTRVFYLVFVGALNVGKIVINKIPELKTNKSQELKVYENRVFSIKKGEELGRFEMGSTVVAIFPKEFLQVNVTLGENIKFAQTIGKIL